MQRYDKYTILNYNNNYTDRPRPHFNSFGSAVGVITLSKMSSKEKTENSNVSKKTDLGLLEEDDDFEEFPAEGKHLIKHGLVGLLFWLCRWTMSIVV